MSLVSGAGTEIRNISSSQRSLTVAGLRPYTQYSCTIQAGTVAIGPATPALLLTTSEDGMPHSVVSKMFNKDLARVQFINL